MVTKYGYPLGYGWIIRDNSPCIAVGAQVFSRIETKSRRMAQCANLAPTIKSAMSLGGISNHLEASPLSYFQNRLHIAWLPIQVDRNNSACSRCDCGCQ